MFKWEVEDFNLLPVPFFCPTNNVHVKITEYLRMRSRELQDNCEALVSVTIE